MGKHLIIFVLTSSYQFFYKAEICIVTSDWYVRPHLNLHQHTLVRYTRFSSVIYCFFLLKNLVNQVTMELGRKGIVLIFKIRNTMFWQKQSSLATVNSPATDSSVLVVPPPREMCTPFRHTLDPGTTMRAGPGALFPGFIFSRHQCSAL